MIFRLDENNNLICGYDENYPYFSDDWNLINTDLIPNDSFYIKHWNGAEWIEGATPEEIAQQNQLKFEKIKNLQYNELLLTDWYYTRFLETGQEVPLEIKQQRQEIRNKYINLIQEINNE